MGKRISVGMLLASLLLTFAVSPVLGHHVISIGCDEETDQIKVVANVFDNHKIVVEINGIERLNQAVAGGNADHTFLFPYIGGSAHVEVTLYTSGGTQEDFEEADVDCHKQVTAQVAPCPDATSNTSGIRFIGLLLIFGARVQVDGVEVFPNASGDVTVTPGLRHWEIFASDGVTSLAEGDLLCPTCNTTTQSIPQSIPPSLPDTAAVVQASGGSTALIPVFGLLLALSGLALLNIRGIRQRR